MNVGAVGAQSDRKLFAVHQTHLALRVIRGDAPFPVAIGCTADIDRHLR
jgi:hypothetical protein